MSTPFTTNTATVASDKIALKDKLIYGSAGIADMWGGQTLNYLQVPIFTIALGISPTVAGLLMVIFRLWDGFSDPLFGWLSDNTRTRWGRRRPYMFLGAIVLGLTMSSIYYAQKDWSQTHIMVWVVLCGLVIFTAHSCWNVPYQSMLLEMTPDTNERTNLSSVRAYFQQGSSLVLGQLWFLITLPVFFTALGKPDTLLGAQVVIGIMGIVVLCLGILPALFLRERYYETASKQEKVSIINNFKLTFQNRAFLLLAGFALVYIVGSQFAFGLFNFARYYQVAQGDEVLAAKIAGLDGLLSTVCALAGVPFAQWVANHRGKSTALIVSAVISMLGAGLSWICYTPASPYLSLVCNPLLSFAGASIWVIIPSMTADIADDDELTTHERREGAFASIFSWVVKMTFSIGAVLPGPMIELAGFSVKEGAHQSESAIMGMRLILAIAPVVFMFPALFILKRYPLSTSRMHEIRDTLEARRGKL
jgi:GPH family glycoside/pentoside/hexuronide:cation symporter